MKKSKWMDCQGNEFFPKQKGTPSLVKIEHKNTATLDSARSKKKSKVAVLQLPQIRPIYDFQISKGGSHDFLFQKVSASTVISNPSGCVCSDLIKITCRIC